MEYAPYLDAEGNPTEMATFSDLVYSTSSSSEADASPDDTGASPDGACHTTSSSDEYAMSDANAEGSASSGQPQAKPSSAELMTPEPPSPARSRSRQPLKPSRRQLRRRRSPRQRRARRPQAKGPFLRGHRPKTSLYLYCSIFIKTFHSTHGVLNYCNVMNLNPAWSHLSNVISFA